MTDDDTEDLFPRASVLRAVLAFTFRHWARTPWLAVACGAAMLLATLTEVGSLHESALCVRQARTNSERHGSVVRRQADFGMVESCL